MPNLHDAVIFLAAAGLVIPVVKRLNVSPVLGFLLIGIAIGPYGLARFVADVPWLSYLLITDTEGVAALAELGVVFLLFMIGLELSLERLWGMRRLVLGMGTTQILVTAFAIGGIAWAFGNPVDASVLLGGCLALSSTAVVIQLLVEKGRFGTTVGQGSFAVLLAQDLAVVPILFLVGVFGASSGASVWAELGLALGWALVAVVLILGVGRLVARPLLRFVGGANSPELFVAVTLLLIIATASATHAAGLSAVLGAFLAGLLLAESEYRHEIEVNIEPFKGLLLGLFFTSVGMGIDLAAIAENPLWIAASVAGLFALKTIVMTGIARVYGFRWGHAAEMGLLLSQGGEFAFVVIGMATTLGVIPADIGQFMLIVVSATMFLTPSMSNLAQRVGTALLARDEPDTPEETLGLAEDVFGHVVIVGFGRTGQLLARLLNQQQVPFLAFDMDPERVRVHQAQGVPIQLGDASRAAMLEKAHIESAAALAICSDDPGATEKVLQTARRACPDTPVVARARDTEHARELLAQGADRVVPELAESGLQLGHVMFEEMGMPAGAVIEFIERERAEMEGRLSS